MLDMIDEYCQLHKDPENREAIMNPLFEKVCDYNVGFYLCPGSKC